MKRRGIVHFVIQRIQLLEPRLVGFNRGKSCHGGIDGRYSLGRGAGRSR